MLTQGMSWMDALIGGALAAGGLTALFFLKPRRKRRRVPSLFLWRAAQPETRPRSLWRRLTRLRELLLLLLALAALAAALTAPVWIYRAAPPVAVVAEPTALSVAAALAASGDPARTALLVAGGAPVLGYGFGEAARPEALLPRESGPVVNRSEALLLAREMTAASAPDGSGEIVYCGAEAPPWLPENGRWVRVGAPGPAEAAEAPDLRVYFPEDTRPEWLPEGVTAAENPAGADWVVPEGVDWGDAKAWNALFRALRDRRGVYADARQQLTVAAVSPEAVKLEKGAVSLTNWCWLAALALLAFDGWRWTRGKAV